MITVSELLSVWLLTALTPATPRLLGLSLLFVVAGTLWFRRSSPLLAIALLLLPLGIATACASYASLLFALAIFEPAGEARGFTFAFALASLSWAFAFGVLSLPAVRRLSRHVSVGKAASRPILAPLFLVLCLDAAILYALTDGTGSW